MNNGDGTFAPHFTLPAGIGTQHIVATDLDGDGNIDLAASNFDNDGTPGNNISVFINLTSPMSVNRISPLPHQSSIAQNYPNPFNPSTTIRFQIPEVKSQESEVGIVTVKIYDLLGQEVATLVIEELMPGSYEVTWDASGFPSGVYFYRLATDGFVETKKLMLMR